MRWVALTAALIGFCGIAEAREPLARPMERTPSIMVGGEKVTPSRAVKRRPTARSQAGRAARTRSSRVRSTVTPRAGSIYEAETGSINRSIGQEQQRLQLEQRQQVDNNLFRQEIQRSTSSPIGTPRLGCTPGSLGC